MRPDSQGDEVAMLIVERDVNGEMRFTDGIRDVGTVSLAVLCQAVDRCEKTIRRWISGGDLQVPAECRHAAVHNPRRCRGLTWDWPVGPWIAAVSSRRFQGQHE